MTTKSGGHTPGPWGIVREDAEVNNIYHINQKEFGAIADVFGKRNACLIAACPVMYNFIESLAKEGDSNAKKIIDSIVGRTA
jgi:hypothetical protein